MEKLTSKDINRVKDTLTGFIKESAGCEDSQELNRKALSYFGKAFADKPALIKQAAAAFNSNKSIFKLSSADTAASDFALLDGNALFKAASADSYNRLIEKSANHGAAVVFGKEQEKVENVTKPVVALNKLAAKPEDEPPMSTLSLHNYITDVTKDRERVLCKAAARRDICKMEALDAQYAFCRHLNGLSKEARAAAVNNILNAYPIDGKPLIEAYNNYNPLNKVASYSTTVGTKSFPKGDIYTKAKDCMVANYALKQATMLCKEACVDTFNSYKTLPGIYVMYKKAAGLTDTVGKAALAHPFISQLTDSEKLSKDDFYKDVMSNKLINELRELETKNVLVDMYGEPFIASYPADEIEEATIKALQQLPIEQRKHPRKHISLLKTWVAELLGRGSNLSASDADKILETQKAFEKAIPGDPRNLLKDLS